uniref:ShKT domain-containing protein n=1 Tax=Strongyloides stercoralis TaxID=6248 RepID=A0A0K0EJ90_STRER
MQYYSILLFLSLLATSYGCSDVDPDCKDKIQYCNQTSYQPLMKKYCALTCNLCPIQTTPSPYGVCIMNECPVGAHCVNNYCIPDAPNTTPPNNCVDHATNCIDLKSYCDVQSYIPLMKENCAKTCGYCDSSATKLPTTPAPTGPCISGVCPAGNTCVNNFCYPTQSTTPPNTCVDYASNCSELQQYCNNPVYYDVMKEQCAKTCHFCQ